MKKKIVALLTAVTLAFSAAAAFVPTTAAQAFDIKEFSKLTALERMQLLGCGYPAIVPGGTGEADKSGIEVEDVEIVNWTTRTFYSGSADVSSMQQPFNFWYDVVYMELFGDKDPAVNYDTNTSDWQKKGTEKFTEYLNAYESGQISLADFNKGMEEIALDIQKLVNESEGTALTISYVIKKKDGTFSNSDLICPSGIASETVVAPTYISNSGKEAVYANAVLLEAKTTETVKVKAGSKSVTASWTPYTTLYVNGEKVSKDKSVTGADGYQIRYSTDKNFKKSVKKAKVSVKTTKKKITGLKKGKTYYVQVRTYNKVGGKTYYGSWSTAQKSKVK